MPPRKRAQAEPAPDGAEEAALPGKTPEAEASAEDTLAADPVPEPIVEGQAADPAEPDAATGNPDEATGDGPRADDGPCPICVPGGWVDGMTAVGCEHGHWVREATG